MNSTEFRDICRRMRTRGYTLGRIMKFTDRPKTSVYFHIRDIALSSEIRAEIAKRNTERIIKFNRLRKGKSILGRHPRKFSSWTKNLVALVSHLLFDGEIRYSGCIYTNRSRVLLNRVRRPMRLVYGYAPQKVESTPGVYRISYHNVELATYLKEKSEKLLQFIPTAPRKLRLAFLRSFFDDEGSVYFIRKKRLVRGYQHSPKILLLIHELLRGFGIASKIDAKYHEITISRKENLKRFVREINFSPGIRINGNRSNSIWKRSLEKREILRMAITSYQK